MRIAVVDIGSNSTRLLIADVAGGRVQAELERRSTVTRLGAGVDVDGRLREDAMERVFSALDEYKAEIDRRGCEHGVAVLTSAVRDSANGGEFAEAVRDRYGLEPHVLTGDEEARLTFLGATSERDPGDSTPTLVFDIGGGSTEMVVGAGHEVSFHVSTQAGVVRQTERHLHDDPPTESECQELSDDVRKVFAEAVPPEQREHVARDRGRRHRHLAGGDRPGPRALRPRAVHGYELSAAGVRAHPGAAVAADTGRAPRGGGPASRPRPDDHRGGADLRAGAGAVRTRSGRGLRARHPARGRVGLRCRGRADRAVHKIPQR